MYKVKEIFYSLQGEGAQAGRPAVFCRFTGCNLWSGREADRHKAVCRFCDTNFVGIDGNNGGQYEAAALVQKVLSLWPVGRAGKPLVICTGGEPLLQLDETLINAFHEKNIEVAVETNGTVKPPRGIDWLCVSPKAGAALVITSGDELKLVFPQKEQEAQPDQFTHLQFSRFYLQPMDGPDLVENTQLTLAYCLEHPQWNMSIQVHKILGIE
ncbi:MAG: 7-carboxy-7-deazaguanine synthase [Saprospiraceae bacterium]|nr:7-carboxy-7-deazaguanine synthase [Saprospiraceae bacterium]MCB9323301.1 7-carboxy-7-deazaguanine synthase [Lewinellaceae bacterium]